MSWTPRQRVVVPVDFSDESLAAVDVARDLVADAAHLSAIHVLPVPVVGDPGLRWNAMDEEAERQQITALLEERLASSKFAGVELAVAFGDPGHEIVKFAESRGAELIVLPSHGRRGIRRLLIGSVAERVVRLAHCPVLVLRK